MIHSFAFEGAWLTEQGEVHTILAQLAPPTNDIMKADASRPWVVETLRQLLGPTRRLAQIVTGDKPAILVLPELALGFEDWTEVDELVRGWARPLIVIAGFGFTSGARLNSWLGQEGPTARKGAWPEGSGPENERVYNGGFFWVHRPGATTSIIFLKVTAEQHHEIHVDALDQGTCNLCVRLSDLIIFPVICSDLLSTAGGHRVVPRKMARYLEDHASDGSRVLVVGLLLQEQAHEKWRTAIVEVARNINSDRVNVCLVNCAHPIHAMLEDTDRWRDYSGAYIAKGRHAYLEHFRSVRRFSSEQIDGAVVRATSASVVGGPLRWTFDSATGRHLWAVNKDYGVSPEGALVESPCADRFRFELLRSLRRFTEAHDAPTACKTDLARSSYAIVEAQINSNDPPSAEELCQKLLFGEPGGEAARCLDAESLSDFIHETSTGLRVLGALKSNTNADWQADRIAKGQLRLQGKDVHVLVWSYPGPAIKMRQTLQRWRSEFGAPRPLLVFKKATGASYLPPHQISERRRDIGQHPWPKRRTADEPAPSARIIECNLDDIEECFAAEDGVEFATAVHSRLQAALDAGGSLVSVEGWRTSLARFATKGGFKQSVSTELNGLPKLPDTAILWRSTYAHLLVLTVAEPTEEALAEAASLGQDWLDLSCMAVERADHRVMDAYLLLVSEDPLPAPLLATVREIELDPTACRKHVAWPYTGDTEEIIWRRLLRVTALGLPVSPAADGMTNTPSLHSEFQKQLLTDVKELKGRAAARKHATVPGDDHA